MHDKACIAVAACIVAVTCLLAAVAAAYAQGNGNGNAAKLGAQLASQGGGGALAPCASCHGTNGEGNAGAGFPRLAAQSAAYLERQLEAFANGSRKSNAMTPIAVAMTAAQRHAAAEYYASLTPKLEPASTSSASASRGRLLATIGDAQARVQACANCHGPDGQGEPPSFPYLAGQSSAYLAGTLRDWKKGARATDPSGHMNEIAKALSDDQLVAVARYYERLPPPSSVNVTVQPPTVLVTVPSTQPGTPR